ncbi:MAG: class I SAM-dependent methyltransferase [bacterium]
MTLKATSQNINPAAIGAQAWWSDGLAQQVLEAEESVIHQFSEDLFGYQLLQIGSQPNLVPGLEKCAIRSKALVICGEQGDALRGIMGMPEALPVKSDSIDVVVMPHTLDFAEDPRQVLREVERILIPEGRVIVSGFNPLSLWGARRAIRQVRNRQPWRAHFISTRRLHDWLSLLGFDVEIVEQRMFRPPWVRSRVMKSLQGLEKLGEKYWSWAGATYVIRAVKRVSTVTPVKPHWRLEKSLGNRAVEPSASSGYGNIIPFRDKRIIDD